MSLARIVGALVLGIVVSILMDVAQGKEHSFFFHCFVGVVGVLIIWLVRLLLSY